MMNCYIVGFLKDEDPGVRIEGLLHGFHYSILCPQSLNFKYSKKLSTPD